MDKNIKITEVGPRDGLQNEKQIIEVEDKYEFILKLLHSGISKIEVTSFVRPDKIPQLKDSMELSSKLNDEIKEKSSVLVPNEKGYENAIKYGFKEIALFTSASNTFNLKNINISIKDSILNISKICKLAARDKIKVRIYISTIVHCPYEGSIDPNIVLNIINDIMDYNPIEISLGDTIGLGTPVEIEKLFNLILKKYPPNLFAGHFHDTYGFALSNVFQSLIMGIRSFDSSAGGLGGCPYAMGASGNLATEDLVYFLERSGFNTGISLPKVIEASKFIEERLGKELPSKTYKALNLKKQGT